MSSGCVLNYMSLDWGYHSIDTFKFQPCTMGNRVGLDTPILTSGKKPVSVLGMVAVSWTAVRRLFVTWVQECSHIANQKLQKEPSLEFDLGSTPFLPCSSTRVRQSHCTTHPSLKSAQNPNHIERTSLQEEARGQLYIGLNQWRAYKYRVHVKRSSSRETHRFTWNG
jgi:hypothetical protein